MCKGHELFCLICRIAKHVPLVASTDVFQGFGTHAVHTCSNLWRLLLNVHKDLQVAGL